MYVVRSNEQEWFIHNACMFLCIYENIFNPKGPCSNEPQILGFWHMMAIVDLKSGHKILFEFQPYEVFGNPPIYFRDKF